MLCGATLFAQDEYKGYLDEAYKQIAIQNCNGAEKNYKIYKQLSGKTDASFEALYAECMNVNNPKDWRDDCWLINLANGDTLAVQKGTENVGCFRYGDAKLRAESSRLGGFTDWRLPTKEEMAVIVLQHNYYENNDCPWFWTATLYYETGKLYVNGCSDYAVIISCLGRQDKSNKNLSQYYLCVRKFGDCLKQKCTTTTKVVLPLLRLGLINGYGTR